MANIYSAGNNRQIIIYAAGTNIFIRIIHFGGIDRPVILANDYNSGLTDCIYNNTLLYAYINTEGSLCIKSISENQNIYSINAENISELSQPQLANCNNTLLLFYKKNNPLNNRSVLCCIAPYGDNCPSSDNTIPSQNTDSYNTNSNNSQNILTPLPIPLPACVSNINTYNVFRINRGLLICIDNHIFIIEKIGHFIELSSDKCTIKEITDNCDKKIAACQAKINEQSAVIDSITAQYNELMDVARQYRDEVLKWRKKFM